MLVPEFAVKIGEVHVKANAPISPELRKAMLKAVRQAFRGFDTDLGHGVEMVLVVEKD